MLTRFSPLKVYENFFSRSRAANSAVFGRIWPNFELVRVIINVHVICKYEEDLIKNEGARVLTRFSPLKPYGSFPLPWKPEFLSDLAKTSCSLSPTLMMLQIKFGWNRPAGCGNNHV